MPQTCSFIELAPSKVFKEGQAIDVPEFTKVSDTPNQRRGDGIIGGYT